MKSNYVIHPLKPIFQLDACVLILGSFPSVLSREKNFYYANPTNRFWSILEEIYQEKALDKEAFCHQHKIALWDVIASCSIEGSSDQKIKDVTYNDIDALIKNSNIKAIFTTGKKASDLYEKHFSIDIPHISLPSTSSANARMRFDELLEKYRIIKDYTDEKD